MVRADPIEVDEVLARRLEDARRRRERRSASAPLRVVVPGTRRKEQERRDAEERRELWIESRRKEMMERVSEAIDVRDLPSFRSDGREGPCRATDPKEGDQRGTSGAQQVERPEESRERSTSGSSASGDHPKTFPSGEERLRRAMDPEWRVWIGRAVESCTNQELEDLLGWNGGDQFHDGIQSRLGIETVKGWERFAKDFLQETRRVYDQTVCKTILAYTVCSKAYGNESDRLDRRCIEASKWMFGTHTRDVRHSCVEFDPHATISCMETIEMRRRVLQDRLLLGNRKHAILLQKFYQSILEAGARTPSLQEGDSYPVEVGLFVDRQSRMLGTTRSGCLERLYGSLFKSMKQVQKEREQLAKSSLCTITAPLTIEYRRPRKE